MATNELSCSGLTWARYASATAVTGNLFGFTARRIIVQGAGDLYLILPGGTTGNGTVFATSVLPGQQFDVQCDGIGASTTCTLITAQQ